MLLLEILQSPRPYLLRYSCDPSLARSIVYGDDGLIRTQAMEIKLVRIYLLVLYAWKSQI